MSNTKVETVAMFGPSISDPSKVVNRDVPVADIQAYKAAGYKLGSIAEEVPIVYTLADAIAQNEGLDESTEAKAVTYTEADAIEQNEGLDESTKAKRKKR